MGARRALFAVAAAAMLLAVMGARMPSEFEWFSRRTGDITEQPGTVYIKYEVPPNLHDKFIERWGDLDKALQDARGLDFYQMTKPITDNVDFWAYFEWDTVGKMMDYYRDCREIQDFLDFVNENDILREMFPLEPVGDMKREYRAGREGAKTGNVERRRERRDIEDWDPREEPAHVALKLHVPPSMQEDFMDTFQRLQDTVVDQEDNNRFYILRKFATMNCHYVIRGGWDDLESWLDHMTSKHFRKLREYTKDNTIEWTAEPFRVLYSNTRKM